MARTPATFKQDDVTRALRAADAAGRKVRRVEIGRDGMIVLVMDEVPEPEPKPTTPAEIML